MRSLVLLLLFANAQSGVLRAEPLTNDNAVTAGRDALRSSASFPWYDADDDSLRDLHAKEQVEADTNIRKTGWELKPAAPSTGTGQWQWNFPAFSIFGLLQYLAIFLFVALIGALVYFLIRYLIAGGDAAAGSLSSLPDDVHLTEVDRVEQLPFIVRKPKGDFLSEARELYEAGRFAEAIIYLFSYQLVQLDRHQHIHLAKGKTNRQYLREVRSVATLRNVLEGTMIPFEDVFFGHHALGRERFEDCWRRLDEFHRALDPGTIA